MRILLVDGHREVAEAMAACLRREGMTVDLAWDGPSALERTAVSRYDVVVLNRDLPGMHGDQVCRALMVQRCTARVLMLTAAATIEDRVDGLASGADDCLPKPFAFDELPARIRHLTRNDPPVLHGVLRYGDVYADPGSRIALRAGRRVQLEPEEFAVLELLLAAQGRTVSAAELEEGVRKGAYGPSAASVEVTVGRLRRKLGAPPVIQRVPRSGYRMRET